MVQCIRNNAILFGEQRFKYPPFASKQAAYRIVILCPEKSGNFPFKLLVKICRST
jgi:hypothetical protein